MSETSTKSDAKERVASHVYFASLYFITVGILYLWGYWAPFGINILEYLELSDILKATAYPIATAILMTTIGAAIGEWRMANRDHLTPGGGRYTIIGRFLRKFSSHLLVLYVGGAIALLLFGPVEKWRVLPILLSLPIYIFAQQTNFLAEIIPHESPRSIVFTCFPCYQLRLMGMERLKQTRFELPGILHTSFLNCQVTLQVRMLGRSQD
jgi:hypothetical protein